AAQRPAHTRFRHRRDGAGEPGAAIHGLHAAGAVATVQPRTEAETFARVARRVAISLAAAADERIARGLAQPQDVDRAEATAGLPHAARARLRRIAVAVRRRLAPARTERRRSRAAHEHEPARIARARTRLLRRACNDAHREAVGAETDGVGARTVRVVAV